MAANGNKAALAGADLLEEGCRHEGHIGASVHQRSQRAKAILLAAQEVNWGPIQFEGELHDRATYRYFWELVQRANVTGLPLPEIVKGWFSQAAKV